MTPKINSRKFLIKMVGHMKHHLVTKLIGFVVKFLLELVALVVVKL